MVGPQGGDRVLSLGEGLGWEGGGDLTVDPGFAHSSLAPAGATIIC